MDRVRDLTATDGRADELLTNTSGGLFDAQYLSGDPPTAYLADYEQPQYVLRNKKAGLEVTQAPDVDSTTPDGDHQALAVVTDCRLLFLVGRAGGDESVSVRHDDVVEATAESSGFLTSALVVEVVGGERYRFPCRGDVSPIADYVEDAAQTWANASRLTDEASDQLAASREALDDGEFDQARAVLDDVAAKVTTAQERVSAVGDGASEALEERASRLFETLRKLEQEIAAMKGAHHHAAGQEAWKTDHDFEQAAREYDRAVEEYERALAAEGTTPSDESVQLRLKGLVKERELLRAAPMADAKAAREVAMATDDPDEAATEWETALTCYLEAVTLDWGSPTASSSSTVSVRKNAPSRRPTRRSIPTWKPATSGSSPATRSSGTAADSRHARPTNVPNSTSRPPTTSPANSDPNASTTSKSVWTTCNDGRLARSSQRQRPRRRRCQSTPSQTSWRPMSPPGPPTTDFTATDLTAASGTRRSTPKMERGPLWSPSKRRTRRLPSAESSRAVRRK